jgi:hypothetical protein
MLKKMMLLASMALAAVAFAVPASASAHEWTHEGAGFAGNLEVGLNGFAAFGGPGENFGCATHADATLEGGTTTGEITAFNINTAACAAEGNFVGCELESATAEGLPWTIHITAETKITITNAVIHNHFKPGTCFATTIQLTFPDVTVTALGGTDPWNFSSIFGVGTAHIELANGEKVTQEPIGAFGEFESEQLNTWGVS